MWDKMMPRHAILFTVFLLTLLPPGAHADSPPVGYVWIDFADIGARFLRPDHWEASFKQGKLMASLVMQEKTANTHTRVTINVVPNLTKTNFQRVSEQLKHYADVHDQADGLSVLSRSAFTRGSFQGEDLTMIQSTDASGNLNIQRIYLANDQKDWLVIVNFQSEEAHWAALEELRHTVMYRFKIQ